MSQKKLEWDAKYSVGVEEIDNQHKVMFATINELVDAISEAPTREKISRIVEELVAYKKFHFATEEKYFKQFNYAGAEEHIQRHREFSAKLDDLSKQFADDPIQLAFNLVDFLEDWLIYHLMNADQKYKECFHEHGLK